MRYLTATSRLALATSYLSFPRNSFVGVVAAFSSVPNAFFKKTTSSTLPFGGGCVTSGRHGIVNSWSNRKMDTYNRNRIISSKLFSSSSDDEVVLTNIDKEAMEEILEDYEEGGRDDSGYVVMDVREPNEIEATGNLSPNVINFPLQALMEKNAFSLEEDEFEKNFGFDKPAPDETLVFTCAAGIRAGKAAQFAAQNGYTKLIVYQGGAKEWFS